MKKRIVLNLEETKNNQRNSEGCFFRAPNGDILYAYSRYNSRLKEDDDPCDIALIRSSDEGETWSKPEIIVKAEFFGVRNIMCASALPLNDGRMCVYFLVNENDGSTTIARAISKDGVSFKPERCICNMPKAFYVIENDRFIRLADGRVATAASKCDSRKYLMNQTVVAIVSDDDGKEFHLAGACCSLPFGGTQKHGLEEPILVELSDNLVWVLARSMYSYQYQAFSADGLESFTPAEPSVFTSQLSPISVKRLTDKSLIAAYNPMPSFNGRQELLGDMLEEEWWSGRTPFVLRRSTDNGKTWGKLHIIEDEKKADFAYPALFETNDGGILCAYWCKTKGRFFSMRIMKFDKIPE